MGFLRVEGGLELKKHRLDSWSEGSLPRACAGMSLQDQNPLIPTSPLLPSLPCLSIHLSTVLGQDQGYRIYKTDKVPAFLEKRHFKQ